MCAPGTAKNRHVTSKIMAAQPLATNSSSS